LSSTWCPRQRPEHRFVEHVGEFFEWRLLNGITMTADALRTPLAVNALARVQAAAFASLR
jgi:hypothetical protein